MPPRILILSTGHLSNNPRVIKEATTLGEAGYNVTVVGKCYLKQLIQCDRDIIAKSPFSHSSIDMLGGKAGSFTYIRGLMRRAEQSLALKALKYLNWESAAALGPASALLSAARRIPADLTIVHNETAQWVGLQLIGEGRRVAVDFEDWNSENIPPTQSRNPPLSLLRRNESAILHQAIYATTTSKALADGLYARYRGQRPEVITNSFPLPTLPIRQRRPPETPCALFWFSQTIGPGRGLEAFLAAYGRTKTPSSLTLLGQIHVDYRRHLLSLLPQNIQKQVYFHGTVSPAELPSIIMQHDVGLALEESTTANKYLTISNKILQYLGAGLAVLATPSKGQLEVLSKSPQAGLLLDDLDDAQATATALDALFADPVTLGRRQQAARCLAESHYCWEREAPKLLALVQDALSA